MDRTFGKAKVYDYPRFFGPFRAVDATLIEFQSLVFMATNLTRKDVENIAHLARLQLTEQQLPVYAESLSRIMNFVEQLNAADTGQVQPMAHPLSGQTQRLRVDEVTAQNDRERYQRNAAQVQAGLYLVPKVIE